VSAKDKSVQMSAACVSRRGKARAQSDAVTPQPQDAAAPRGMAARRYRCSERGDMRRTSGEAMRERASEPRTERRRL